MTQDQITFFYKLIRDSINDYLATDLSVPMSVTANGVDIVLTKLNDKYDYTLCLNGLIMSNSFEKQYMDDTVTEAEFMAGWIVKYIG
jgi:hypothetical protein